MTYWDKASQEHPQPQKDGNVSPIDESGWQDIASARKDRSQVWIAHICGLMVPAYFNDNAGGFWVESYTGHPVQWRPTHWQPLPKPPSNPFNALLPETVE